MPFRAADGQEVLVVTGAGDTTARAPTCSVADLVERFGTVRRTRRMQIADADLVPDVSRA